MGTTTVIIIQLFLYGNNWESSYFLWNESTFVHRVCRERSCGLIGQCNTLPAVLSVPAATLRSTEY